VSLGTLAAVFAWSFWIQREELITSLDVLRPQVFLIAVGLHLLALTLWSIRLWLLADGAGHRIPMAAALEGVFSGVFVAAVTPARVGGEPVRFAVLQRRGVPPREATLLVVLGRAFDTTLFLVMGIAAFVFLVPQLPSTALLAIGIPAGLALMLAVFVIPLILVFRPGLVQPFLGLLERLTQSTRVREARERLAEEAARTRAALRAVLGERPSRLPLALVFSVATWFVEWSVVYYLLHAFGHEVPFLLVALGAVLVTLLTILPVLPGGAGVAEVGALGVFTPVAPGLTATFVLVWRTATYYVDLTVGGIMAFRFAGAETRRVLGGEDPQEEAEELAEEAPST
jgi:uncharacterized protein (TIRG00374 family)